MTKTGCPSTYTALEAPLNHSDFLTFPSPAKLNLFLHVVGVRQDGYHELQTLFQFLDHGDTLSLKITPNSDINLLTPIAGVHHSDNLIVKAAKLLQQHTKSQLGAQIKITKVLPMGGGLGGGSSNAATVLLALNALWHTQLSIQQLAHLGLSLGADIPIFIHGYAAFAQGVGEQLLPAKPPENWYLVAKPDCSISTQSVFQSADLPRNSARMLPSEFSSNAEIDLCHNDCQTMVIKHHSEVANLLACLVEYAPSRMTGTGACVFSRFDSKIQARHVQAQLPKGIESFVAKGLNQSPVAPAISALNIKR
jgi:4-diphosphocytidyl-2-C-methyl-D-erythritol kinase